MPLPPPPPLVGLEVEALDVVVLEDVGKDDSEVEELETSAEDNEEGKDGTEVEELEIPAEDDEDGREDVEEVGKTSEEVAVGEEVGITSEEVVVDGERVVG